MGSSASRDDEYSEVPEHAEQGQSHPTALDGLKLTYFDMPGRGEAIRLALICSGVTFEDERIQFADWPKLKNKTPFLCLPVLALPDGQVLAQTPSILRWIGKESSPRLYPADPMQAARVDELMDALCDAQVAIMATGTGLESDSREAARKAALQPDGSCTKILSKIDAFVKQHGAKDSKGALHAVGNSLTIADIKLFWFACFVVSGFLDGVPAYALDEHENLQAVRKTVGNLPEVKAHYERRAALSFGTPPKYELTFTINDYEEFSHAA